MYLLARIIYLIGGFIVTLLGLRFLLVLLGANADNGLVNLIYSASLPFVKPFFGMFNYNVHYGSSTFELATLVAMVVYAAATAILASIVTPRYHSTV